MLTTNTPNLTTTPSADASIFKGIEDAITNFEENIKKYYRTLVDYAKGTGQTRDAAVGLVNNDQVKLYVNRNFKELAKTDLKKPINDDGDTIIHLIAFNNDREAFENIRRENSKALSYDVINNPNKKGQLPIQFAAQGRKNAKDNTFINYMVKDLKANPNINDNNQALVREKLKENELKIADDKNIKNLNDMIMANIENLTKLSDQTGSSCGYNGAATSTNTMNVQNNDRDFVIKLTNMYAQKNLTGGYSGKRRIRGYQSDHDLTESGANDSFVSKNKNNMLNNRNNNLDSDDLYTEYSDEDSASNRRNTKSLASTDISTPDLDFSDYRTSRDARASANNPNASRASRENMQRVKKFDDDWQTEDFDLNTTKNNDVDVDTSEIDTEYIRGNSGNERTNVTNVSNERRSDFNDDDNNNDDEVDYDDDDDDDDDAFGIPDDDEDLITSQDRTKNNSSTRRRAMSSRKSTQRASANRRQRPQRDAKIDEVYRNFLQKIIDKLGVDDQTARTYRSAIKILIERDNPELRGRENDSLKVKKMEEIIGDDKQFQNIIKRVDAELDDIKRFMEERRQEAEKRRKEWQERRKTMTKSSDKETTSDNKTSDSKSETTEKPKRKQKSKVNESGYLESDEIIISPSY